MKGFGYVICMGALLAYSCTDNSSTKREGTQQWETMQINTTALEVDNKPTPPIVEKKDSVYNYTKIPIDSYEEGLLDGEAMAEEDRLAGKPGMQNGMENDDDDEEYEEGFDDGYDG